MITKIKNEISEFKIKIHDIEKLLKNIKSNNNKTIDFNKIVDDGYNISLKETFIRIQSQLKIADSMSDNSNKNILIPRNLLNNIFSALNEAKNDVDNIINTIQSSITNSNIADISDEKLGIIYNSGEYFDIKQVLQKISLKCDEVYYNSINLQNLTESKNFNIFSDFLKNINQDNDKISDERKKAESTMLELSQLKEKSMIDANYINEHADNIKTIFINVEKNANFTDNASTQIQDKLQKINEITNDYDTLKDKIKNYHIEFNNFDEGMKSRNENYIQARKKLDETIKFVNDSTEIIKKNINESEKLLSGSTNSALASELKKQLDALTKDLSNSIYIVYIANIILLIVAGYIAHEILKIPVGDQLFIKNLTIRGLVVLPALFFFWFANKRYTNLFKLKEHYAYKYAIASSVEGFKKQAVGYENQVAMYAFYELGLNPAHEINTKQNDKDHKNSSIRDLINKIISKNQTQIIDKISNEVKIIEQ